MITQDQLVGARFEKCVVEKLIGRGGYGLTFLAFDEELQEHRVIKVSQDAGMDDAMKRRHLKSFLEEGLILSRLKHPQIVTLRGQGDKHNHRYMILDYIQGFSLRNVIDLVQQRQEELGCAWGDLMDPITATALVLSALYPLEYAHRANVHLPDREIFGVAHRDISPGNLILGVKGNEKGRLILIDFGTAKTDLKENITVDQNLVGTVPYMSKARLQKANSPEQMALYQTFWKDFRETQHDIHALGVLYYQLLTGTLPFAGETSPQIIIKILDPESYSQSHRKIASTHPFASAILRKCLVFHDFTQPLSEQPYQYSDAASMLPEMVAVFDNLSSGNSVHEILVNLATKLARPNHWVPSRGQEIFESPPSTDIQNTLKAPLPTRYFALQDPSSPKSRLGIYIVAVLCTIGLAFAANLWLRSQSQNALGIEGKSPGEALPNGIVISESQAVTDVLEKIEDPLEPSAPSNRLKKKNLEPAKPRILPIENSAKAKIPGEIKSASNPEKERGESLKEISPYVTPLNKETYVEIQTLVRAEDPSAYDQITLLLLKNPNSPDLTLLKCQLVLDRNPASKEARAELASLLTAKPEFSHSGLFHETAMYLLFQTDAAIYEAQKTPTTRINMQKSGNAYLAEFAANSAYEQKVEAIRERLSR